MPAEYVQLKCENCGAPLRVFEGEQRLRCGHCRAEMIAVRRENDVSLELVEQLGAVASSAERTADELLHARLRAEVESLQARMKPLRERLYMVIGLCVLFSGPLFLLGLFLIKSWGFVLLLMAGGVVALAVWSAKKISDHQFAREEREVVARMREVEARLDAP
ncbi:MAG: hypothetical protein U0640_01610 [Phycisphaerales bacterium]